MEKLEDGRNGEAHSILETVMASTAGSKRANQDNILRVE